MSEFCIPVRIEETRGLRRAAAPVRIGVPLPEGLLRSEAEIGVSDASGKHLPHQARALAFWGDRSIKWLLLDALVAVEPGSTTGISVSRRAADLPAIPSQVLQLSRTATHIHVDTGVAQIQIPVKGRQVLSSVVVAGRPMLSAAGAAFHLRDVRNLEYLADIHDVTIEESGTLMAVVVASGGFSGSGKVPKIRFAARMKFIAGSTALCLEFKLWNPEPALHPGGLWDLGDPGSYHFRDLTLKCVPAEPVRSFSWYAEDPAQQQESISPSWVLYQDSSGGEHWDSPNHIDRFSESTVRFRGYRVTGDTELSRGSRATPGVTVLGDQSLIAATVRDFWQTFPKALRWQGGCLHVALFPEESIAGFELQGGEQKRHAVLMDFATSARTTTLAEMQHPVAAAVDPAWTERTKAIAWFTAATPADDPRYSAYVWQIVDGPNSAFAKREIIDEYGWRNFGDLYADHEAVNHIGPGPFISHYNNQYDFIYGAFLQFQRTGNTMWYELMVDAARHCIDIDIYKTEGDKAAFNGGLFWHTDHYKSASTCTHRTYSSSNGAGRSYGGGPGNEHNYTSGLLCYYYMTGDSEAAAAVLGLAEWVINMDDGTRNILGLVSAQATGAASATVSPDYHKAGRGAGNSINALLDAYAFSRDRRFMSKAEELIQRSIHPRDDIALLKLDEPEYRWSYLVFLQILAKYLETKASLGEFDYHFCFARDGLLHYAEWVCRNEVPYKDVLHKVHLPTETWPAHDIRKCHVLHASAKYASASAREELRLRATYFFDRSMTDLLGFSTAHLTRPQVIMAVYGSLQSYFEKNVTDRDESAGFLREHGYYFGDPPHFVPQRTGLQAELRGKLRLTIAGLAMIFRRLATSVVRIFTGATRKQGRS